VIKNYTGDIMNFELAAGFARVKGVQVRYTYIYMDVLRDLLKR
jgi:dihydroxyacetone kinase